MRLLYISICLLFMAPTMMAQSGIVMGSQGFRTYQKPGDIFQRFNEFGLTETDFNAIKDGMYSNSNFLTGSIFEDGKEVVRDLYMRYNAYTDDIEAKENKRDEAIHTLNKAENISVKIALDPFVYLPDTGAKESSGFMQVLVDGEKYKLYKKIVVTFHPAVKATSGYDSDTPAKFSHNVYYYLVQNGELMEIPSRKSRAMAMLEKENSGMKNFIKKSKLNIREEGDLQKAVEHLNNL